MPFLNTTEDQRSGALAFSSLSSQLLPLCNLFSPKRCLLWTSPLNFYIEVVWSDWGHLWLSFHDLRALGQDPVHPMCVGRGRERWEDRGLFWERAENSFAYRAKVTQRTKWRPLWWKKIMLPTLKQWPWITSILTKPVFPSTSKDSLKLVL